MYRHTIKTTEPLGVDDDFISYYQTDWSSIRNLVTDSDKEIVYTETKEINIATKKNCYACDIKCTNAECDLIPKGEK